MLRVRIYWDRNRDERGVTPPYHYHMYAHVMWVELISDQIDMKMAKCIKFY